MSDTTDLLNQFKNPQKAKSLVEYIHTHAPMDTRYTFMEVCGTHTMAIHRNGIKSLMPAGVKLISGPGCPVCVTPTPYLDAAIELLQRPEVLLTSFGDMLRVPGSVTTLEEQRAIHGRVQVVYSPIEAVEIAKEQPNTEVVFLAIGFETTIPTIAAALSVAVADKVKNFSLLVGHKVVPPALEALLGMPDIHIDGFILPGHVSIILGADAYIELVKTHKVPSVVMGFEPVDVLLGITMLMKQLNEKRAEVENAYPRVVTASGNKAAQMLVERFYDPVNSSWRGIGAIPASGLALKSEFAPWDAAKKFDLDIDKPEPETPCRCGEVLTGAIDPPACPLFGKVCTPTKPVGACMVSSEGTCAAWFKYGA